MLDEIIEAKRGGTCAIMGNRFVSSSNRSMVELGLRSFWYIEAKNLYGYAMMQNLPYKDFKYQGTCFADSSTSLDDK